LMLLPSWCSAADGFRTIQVNSSSPVLPAVSRD
jgi:hypothetical protein